MAPKTGHKMKLYRDSAAIRATPVYDVIDEVSDVNVPDFSMGMAEFKRRSKDYTKNLPSLIQTIALEFTLFHGVDATGFTDMRTDFLAGTARDYYILDGAASGSQGLILPGLINNFPWNQPLEEVSDHPIRIVTGYFESPAGTEVDPSWTTLTKAIS